MKYILNSSIFMLLIVGCGPSGTNNKSNKNDISNATKYLDEQKPDFYSTDFGFNINGISVLDTFELEKYIQVLGQPDSLRKGGPEIIKEFGHDDYDLWYGDNSINAGHGYILTADIKEAGILFNGIQVGDKQAKIESTFKILHSDRDTIKVINNDDVLIFYIKNKVVHGISFWRPL